MRYCKSGSHTERKAREAFDYLENSHDPWDMFRMGAARLNFCNAKVFQGSNNVPYLQSYSTIVAVIIPTAQGNICVANGTYSRTTVQHIYKFARKYSAQVEYLKPQLKAV